MIIAGGIQMIRDLTAVAFICMLISACAPSNGSPPTIHIKCAGGTNK